MAIKYFINRPIAVLSFFSALLLAGLILFGKIPVSLLPDIDVPEIAIHVSYPNMPASDLEQTIIKPIRERLSNLNKLNKIETETADHTGIIRLFYKYNTRMDVANIEVNEEVDRLLSSFPRDFERPIINRANTSDIPIVRLQIIPRNENELPLLSILAQKILKKRIEQIDGVSLADINGLQQRVISVTPKDEILTALRLNKSIVVETIQNASNDLGGLSLKDGQYKYFIRLVSSITNITDILALPVLTSSGRVIELKTIADVREEPAAPTGYHLFNGRKGIVMTIQKQGESRMTSVVPEIKKAVQQFKLDYPSVNFELTQDQTFLLDAGISNLYQDLIFGGILTIGLLFMFLGNWITSLLMSISIPVSLIITFIFFYLFNVSFNIISLSGLTLGIGMLIDNAIVVVDNINRKRIEGASLTESCVNGTNEVIVPVISQVLTTVAVYTPLILLSSLAGALINDQSIALTISLFVSLAVAFVLCPLLYNQLFKRYAHKFKEDTIFYKWVLKKYHRMIDKILQKKLLYFLITLALMPLGILFSLLMPVDNLPEIEKVESLVSIAWNEPINADENLKRMQMLIQAIQKNCILTEAEVGIKQFLLQEEIHSVRESELYFKSQTQSIKINTDVKIRQWLQFHYPGSTLKIVDAPNTFTKLFVSKNPYFEARLKFQRPGAPIIVFEKLRAILNGIPKQVRYSLGLGDNMQQSIAMDIDGNKLLTYGVDKLSLEKALKQQFGSVNISELKQLGEVTNINLETGAGDILKKLNSTIQNNRGQTFPLIQFVSWHFTEDNQVITADKNGPYQSLNFEKGLNTRYLIPMLNKLAYKNGFTVSYSGQLYENEREINTLWFILLIVIFLLYFILVIQYESLLLPVIVMLTIPLGITGGMFCLWLSGGTLNVMSAIGFIIILGLIVDDPILKIETLKRLELRYMQQGLVRDDALLKKMIHEAGSQCLKPLLLVSLTTSIAMVPVFFFNGIGNDLQKPLGIVIIGGLTIGTFFTTWFIPLSYWYMTKNKKNYKLKEVQSGRK